MAHLQIPAATPRVTYIATDGQVNFPVPFAFFSAADLVVEIDGIATPAFAATGVAYDGGFQTGTVTLAAPVAAGDQVRISRAIEIKRTEDFPYPARTLDIKALNTGLDRIVAILQDIMLALTDEEAARLAGFLRTLRVPEGFAVELPEAALRANRLAGFDSTGAPIVMVPGSASVTTVTAADSLIPRLLADRFAERVNLRDYCVGDGTTDDTAGAQAALTRAVQAGKALYVPRGTYRLRAQLLGGALPALLGDGKGASVLIWDDLPSCGISLAYAAYGQALHAQGVTFRQKGTNRGTALLADFSAASLTWPGIWPRLLVEGCSFEGPDIPAQLTGWNIGIDTVAGAFGHVVNCDFNGVAGAPHTGLARGAVAVRFRGTAGGLYHNGHPVYCTVSRCNINNWQVGVHFSGCEGVVARDNSIVEVERGIVATGDTTPGAGARPFILVEGNHVNAYLENVAVTDMCDIKVRTNELYRIATATAHTTGIGIYASTATGVGDLSITGNTLMDTTGAVDFDGVNVGAGVARGLIDGNDFKAVRYGITLQPGTSGLRVGDRNLYQASLAPVVDSGTGNVVASALLEAAGHRRDIAGCETKWGSATVTLNASGDGTVAFQQPFKALPLMVLATWAEAGGTARNIAAPSAGWTTAGFSVSVRPSPGAGTVQIAYVAVGR
ncbi:glycoside hydrolase family 55 protein [Roseomonas sp. NAR14]|uniref:Glycoside hydrolase family 55 protein n=1 Tax=Roseomonas acroporae TaxID=2937791 RepID=A0A9X1YBK3_9PROT|nr:glycoside hydrolase family 55 protein [Roseomonas acroporae]MCK8787101.1 glycoside hydrolase family 55 protein [Roseomonas acroporae]